MPLVLVLLMALSGISPADRVIRRKDRLHRTEHPNSRPVEPQPRVLAKKSSTMTDLIKSDMTTPSVQMLKEGKEVPGNVVFEQGVSFGHKGRELSQPFPSSATSPSML